MANVENNALSNTIILVKNYVDDPNNLYGVLRDGLVTGDLETPFISFVGAKTMVYPVFPLNTEDLPDYSGTQGFARVNVNYERKEETVTQDKGYQIAVDRLDLLDGHLNSIMIINNQVRQMEIPTLYDEAIQTLKENEIPVTNTILYCTPAFYTALKNSDKVRRAINVQVNNGEVNREVLMLDGVTKIVQVTSKRLPENVNAILVQPLSVIAGIKRSYSRVVEDPEDIDGILINRRLVHDLFVLSDRAKGVYVIKEKVGA